MATLKFTKKMARQIFDTLPERVPESHLIGLYKKRLAVRRRGDTVLFCFQEFSKEGVIDWVGGINARMYYGIDGKRLPIGSSVDDLYHRVKLWIQQQTTTPQWQPIKEGKTKNGKYPIFKDSERIQFDKNYNNELCRHTGRERWDSPDVSDRWFEYIDSDGELHYGR